MTDSAKVAWSRRNSIRPPEFVIAAAERESAQSASASTSREAGACCQKKSEGDASCASKGCSPFKSKWAIAKVKPAERDEKSSAASRTVKRAGQSLKAAHQKPGSTDRASRTFLLTALIQKCQGHSSYWHSLPWSVIAPRFELPQRVTPVEARWVVECMRIPEVSLQPPAPPPRNTHFSAV